jgi:predicted pyridoxine 5'-phosphate oxidase superfamily flavin-nucleotide-binding protein
LISRELEEFLQSGLSIVVATRDDDLQPDGAVAWAALVHDDRAGLTVYLHDTAAKQLLRNLRKHPEIALDFDLPTSHRACQVKGRYLSSRKARAGERTEIERQLEAFGADLETIGIPRAMLSGWQAWPCSALEVRVTELFEQTPGPGAGEPLR